MSAQLQRAASALALLAALLALGGCGGGGGGGGGGSDGGGGAPPPPVNTTPLVVERGPADYVNVLFTSVTICVPGDAARCRTIDHVQVDTGSSGLRILASALDPSLTLPQQVDAGGNAIVECMQFVDGYSWGPVKAADVRIAGLAAGAVPIQVIGDPRFASIPASCSNTGPPENTVETFGANGLLGVASFLQDCGSACALTTSIGLYYACPASGACQPAVVAEDRQVPNPAALFASDNNGVIIDLPRIPAAGATRATGTLVFGIGTQSNNGLGNATVFPVDARTGNIVTVWNGRTYTNSYVDSGSSVLFFERAAYPICNGTGAGLYCPSSTQPASAIMRGTNGTSGGVSFSVANADALFAANPDFWAFDNLAAPSDDARTFDWGLPFFFGRRVYTAFERRPTPGGDGPYVAY